MQHVRLEDVIAGCQAEANDQKRGQERGYCFELFRRALEEHDDRAWNAIQTQYRRLVLQWAYASDPSLAPDEAEDLAREALERLWYTLRGIQVAERFEHVGALLKYLRLCVMSAIQDQHRREARRQRLLERLRAAEVSSAPFAARPEQQALDHLMWQDQIQQVRDWITQHVHDPYEQLIIKCSFEDDMKPMEIAQRHPEMFPDVRTVRQTKERLLKRLRRALEPHVERD